MNSFIIKFLMNLKSASLFKKEYLSIKYSKQSLELIIALYNEGFIQSYKITNEELYILLRYFFNKPVFRFLKLVSTQSNFRYLNLKTITKLPNKKAVLFLSTSEGILTLSQCKMRKIGGKALFYC